MTPTSSSGRLTVGSAVPLSRGASVPTTRSPEAGAPRPPGGSTGAAAWSPPPGSDGIPVEIRGRRLGDIGPVTSVWPAGWPFPRPGDNVVLAATIGGFVEYVEFDLERRVVTISLR